MRNKLSLPLAFACLAALVLGILLTTPSKPTAAGAFYTGAFRSRIADLTGYILRYNSLIPEAASVSLTSPTKTFSVRDKSFIVLQDNANTTGILPTSGTLWQVVTIKSGAGSNTMRFDDSTSMAVGSSVTLTEGQDDYLTLQCISKGGNTWAAVSAHDN